MILEFRVFLQAHLQVSVSPTFISISSEQERNADESAFLQLNGCRFGNQITIDDGSVRCARGRCTVDYGVQALDRYCAKAIQELGRVLASHTG
jgi:hypothetical protein